MTKAEAGFYKVEVSVPVYDKYGEPMRDVTYVMSSRIATFMIRVIDASIFPVEDNKEPNKTEEDKTQQSSPSINNQGSQSNGNIEDGNATTENANVEIESRNQKTRNYLTIVSIFCAVAIMIAFGIGVGRAVLKRVRK